MIKIIIFFIFAAAILFLLETCNPNSGGNGGSNSSNSSVSSSYNYTENWLHKHENI